jgi:hypothetical protein
MVGGFLIEGTDAKASAAHTSSGDRRLKRPTASRNSAQGRAGAGKELSKPTGENMIPRDSDPVFSDPVFKEF